MSPRTCAVVALVGFAVLGTGCQGEEGQRTGDLDPDAAQERRAQLSPEVAAALDSGNQAYRSEDYEAARGQFRRALEVDSGTAAAWFGLYMTERALGNEEAAREALERAGGLSGEDVDVHDPDPDDTGGEG